MKIKKYTLYFKGINEYGHEHNIPIICVNLRQMDEYTSRFNNYLDLFNSFPIDVKKFIKYEFKRDINFNDNKSFGEHIIKIINYKKNENFLLIYIIRMLKIKRYLV